MRVLFLSQYFPPEVGATQARAHEMVRHLVRCGHEVTVITEVPNHPEGVVHPAYRGRFWTRETWEGIDVIRVWVWTTPRKTFRTRLVFYGTFTVLATLAGLVRARGRYDVVVATSPPLPVGAAGIALARLKGLPLVFEVRDLWPASAVALGALRGARGRRLATRLEEACYRRARGIVVVTRGILDALRARGVPDAKLALIPNGANTVEFDERPDGALRVRDELGLGDAFTCVYAGIHGLAQGLSTLAEAARLRPDVRFVFVGDGPRKAALAETVAATGLSNVQLLDPVPRERVPDFLSAADAVLVPLKDVPLFRGALPSKLFDAWACRRPVILGIAGEAAEVVERAGGGIVVPPEDAGAVARAIDTLRADPALGRAMGARGRAFTEAHHGREALAERFRVWLEDLVSGRTGAPDGPAATPPPAAPRP